MRFTAFIVLFHFFVIPTEYFHIPHSARKEPAASIQTITAAKSTIAVENVTYLCKDVHCGPNENCVTTKDNTAVCLNLCSMINCKNGGKCEVVDNMAYCKCPNSTIGQFCEQAVCISDCECTDACIIGKDSSVCRCTSSGNNEIYCRVVTSCEQADMQCSYSADSSSSLMQVQGELVSCRCLNTHNVWIEYPKIKPSTGDVIQTTAETSTQLSLTSAVAPEQVMVHKTSTSEIKYAYFTNISLERNTTLIPFVTLLHPQNTTEVTVTNEVVSELDTSITAEPVQTSMTVTKHTTLKTNLSAKAKIATFSGTNLIRKISAAKSFTEQSTTSSTAINIVMLESHIWTTVAPAQALASIPEYVMLTTTSTPINKNTVFTYIDLKKKIDTLSAVTPTSSNFNSFTTWPESKFSTKLNIGPLEISASSSIDIEMEESGMQSDEVIEPVKEKTSTKNDTLYFLTSNQSSLTENDYDDFENIELSSSAKGKFFSGISEIYGLNTSLDLGHNNKEITTKDESRVTIVRVSTKKLPLQWMVVMVGITAFLAILVIAQFLAVRQVCKSRRLRGRYNPASEEIALCSDDQPLETIVGKNERLI